MLEYKAYLSLSTNILYNKPMPESRRDFLKHFSPRKSGEGSVIVTQDDNENLLEKTASRRDFVKILGIITATLATGESLKAEEKPTKEQQKKEEVKTTPPFPSKTQEPINGTKKEKEISYTDTFIEQTLMMAAKEVVSLVFTKLGIEHGNKAHPPEELLQKLKEKPIEEFLDIAVLGPLAEELVFRATPSGITSAVFNDKNNKAWGVGITTSAIFAAVHNLKDVDGKTTFVTNSIPITQFMGGIFYWYLIRERGFSHSIMAHSMNNTVGVAQLLLKSYPNKTKSEPFFDTDKKPLR